MNAAKNYMLNFVSSNFISFCEILPINLSQLICPGINRSQQKIDKGQKRPHKEVQYIQTEGLFPNKNK